jgi:hypothetical protein
VSDTLGNFWMDLVRAILWVQLPASLIGALVLVWQGVPMNFHQYTVATTVEGTRQVIPQGPVAALEITRTSAPMEVAFSTPTALIHMRIRRPRAIFSRCWQSCFFWLL